MALSISSERTGELYILSQVILWSLFPVVAILTFASVAPLWTAAIGTLVSSVFFAIVLTLKGTWNQWKRAPWKEILLASFFIGVLLYTFKYLGLQRTTAGNASLMGLLEILYSFLILSVILRKEPVRPLQVLGAVFVAAGALIVLIPKSSGWHTGDLLVAFAYVFPPLGNMYAKRALKRVSAEFVMATRSVIAGCCLLLLAWLIEPAPSMVALARSWPALLLNGVVLLGFSKILWLEGTCRLPITKAVALGSIAPVFTLCFASVILHERIQWYQPIALAPIVAGIFLLTRQRKAAGTEESSF